MGVRRRVLNEKQLAMTTEHDHGRNMVTDRERGFWASSKIKLSGHGSYQRRILGGHGG